MGNSSSPPEGEHRPAASMYEQEPLARSDPLSSYSPKSKPAHRLNLLCVPLRRCCNRSGGGINCGLCFPLLLISITISLIIFLAQWHPDVYNRNPFVSSPIHWEYDVIRKSHISELNSDAVLYQHKKTKTEFFAVIPPKNSGEDKAFGISFRTPPFDSKGTPHILEHSVLCGSTLYPAKDPFLHLLRGSLHTFLNAMTYPDRTVYPIASPNAADFNNLMDVYLDAVFEPRAVTREGWWVLRQEGWRIESGEGANGTEEYKGIVLSEMQGVYSNPEQLLGRYSQNLLFPDTPYRHDSGGFPPDIVTLTHDEFVQFYRQYYHPSNAQIVVFGDKDDVYQGLNKADAYLSRYQEQLDARVQSRVPYQAFTFNKPVRDKRPYPSSGEDGDYMVTITWLLNSQRLTPLNELGFYILDQLLLGTPTSVLRKALIDSKLGSDVLGGGLDNELIQSTFSVGMRGITEEARIAAVEDVIMDTLAKIVKDGFYEDEVESAVNTVEFDLREFNTGSTPRGISIILDTLSKWNYDMDPKGALVYEDALRELKATIEEEGGSFFQSLAKRHLLQNTHRVILELYPDADLDGAQIKTMEDKLNEMKTNNPSDYQSLLDEAKDLATLQSIDDSPEVIASIPTLKLADLDKEGLEYPISVQDDAYGTGVTTVSHKVGASSGIAYVDFGLDTSVLDFNDVPLLSLLTRMMREAGTSSLSDVELDRLIGMHTGGVHVTTTVTSVRPKHMQDKQEHFVTGATNLVTKLFVRGKCTSEKAPKLFDIFAKILKEANLDNQEKAVAILKETVTDIKNDIQSSGHAYASHRIKARYSALGFISENMNGVTELEIMETALGNAQSNWQSLFSRLQSMLTLMLKGHRGGMVLNLTGDKAVVDSIQQHVEYFLKNQLPEMNAEATPLPDSAAVDHPWVQAAVVGMKNSAPLVDEAIVVSTQVSYVGKGGVMYKVGDVVPGSSSVVSRYLKNKYLWETVRVKLGAYGAFDVLDSITGTFSMLSYRDPNLVETLQAFDGAADDLLQEVETTLGRDDGAAVTSAIIGAIGALDGTALPPDRIGWVSLNRWLRAESAAFRHAWREDVLSTTVQDFADFATKLKAWESPTVAVVTSQSAADEAASSISMRLVHVNS